MARYTTSIQLVSLPNVDDAIQIGDDPLVYFKYKFVALRSGINQITIGATILETIQNIETAFNIDHNGSGIYELTPTSDTFSYTGEYTYVPSEITNTSSGRVTTSFTLEADLFSITSINTYSVPSCQTIQIEINTNDDMVAITSPSSYTLPTPDNNVLLDLNRGQTYIVTVEDTGGNEATENYTAPSFLNSGLITITQEQTPTATNIQISDTTSGLTLEYSLDGVTYQSESYFNALADDDYTLYIKDEYGCEIEIEFTTSSTGVTEPYTHISKSNSIRYAEVVDFGICSDFQTDENSLSCQTKKQIKYRENQLFNTCDTITTQIKSNYSSVIPYTVIDEVEVALPITKISDNIGLSEKRDATSVDLGSGVIGIYFTSGNIYNFDTLAVTDTYTLNGELPSWAVLGGYIWYDSSYYLINEISFNDDVESYQIEIAATGTGSVVVGSVWNNENYEIYEFDIDFATYTELQLKIVNTDTNFDTITYLSEIIKVDESHDRTITLEYWNDENTDFFVTDWHHKIHLPYLSLTGEIDNEVDNYKTDSTVITYDVTNYELDRLKLLPVTKEIMRKVVLALSHQNVLIDGVKYAKKEIEVYSLSDNVNLYNINALLIKGESGTDLGIYETTTSSSIPSFVEGSTGFVAYE